MVSLSPARKQLHLTICLNGVPWETDEFSAHTTANHVVAAAIKHFAAEDVAGPGGFALSLVVYGYPNPSLDDETTLGEGHVTNGSLLTLIPRDPS